MKSHAIDLWGEPSTELLEHLEQVREYLVAEYSVLPAYQALAAKNPNYWENFSMGMVNLPHRKAIQVDEHREELLAAAKARNDKKSATAKLA